MKGEEQRAASDDKERTAYLRQAAGVSNEARRQSIPSAATIVQRRAGCCSKLKTFLYATTARASRTVGCTGTARRTRRGCKLSKAPAPDVRHLPSELGRPLRDQRAHDAIPARPLDGTGELRMIGINQVA